MQVLQVLDRLRMKLQEKGDTTQNEKLSAFYETLKSPLFNQILTLQQSIRQLKGQVRDSSALPRWLQISRGCGRIVPLSLAEASGACKLWAASVDAVNADEVYVGFKDQML